jgi:hypothetical protein
MEVGGNASFRPLHPQEKDPVPIIQKAGWAPGPVWTDGENLAYTGIRSQDRPARSVSLYRLNYHSPQNSTRSNAKTIWGS